MYDACPIPPKQSVTEAKMSSLLIFVLKIKGKIGVFKNKVWGSGLRTALLGIVNIHDLKIFKARDLSQCGQF